MSEPRNIIYCSVILWAKGTAAPSKLLCESSDGRRKYRSSDPEIIAALIHSSLWFASEPEFVSLPLGKSTEKGECKWEDAEKRRVLGLLHRLGCVDCFLGGL